MSYVDPSLALQRGVYAAIKDVAGGAVFYAVPADQPLPFVVFGDDDLTQAFEQGGDFTEATVNIEVYANDKEELKVIVGEITAALSSGLTLVGFTVLWQDTISINYRVMDDGLTQQAFIEADYLIQPSE